MLKKKVLKKEKLIGEITHFFDKIKVGVIKLKDVLKTGDKIRIKGGEDTDFTQTIKSMEIDGQKIKIGKKRTSIGLKLNKKARQGYKVYKL